MTRKRGKIHRHTPVVLTTALFVALAGCATVPVPTSQMDRAQSEIRAARNAGAATSAPDALAEAERRFAAAQQSIADADNRKATEHADEAEAAAATARTRAELARLDQQVRQQTEVNAELRADLERRQAAAAAAQQAAMSPASGGTSAAPAAAGSAPVTLPSIQLGQPGSPASASTSGGSHPGGNP